MSGVAMIPDSIVIDSRFCGPPDSGNGGYVCGLLAGFIDGPVGVRLRVPPPLSVALTPRRSTEGVELFRGDVLVAEARPAKVDVQPIAAPTYREAEAAAGRFRGLDSHWFPTCFVCGPGRDAGDGMRIFPGPLDSGEAVACPWVPDASLASRDGGVAPEFLWAALDCPGGFSFPAPTRGGILLGELQVALRGAVTVGERCVLAAWQVEPRGRKHYTATALYGEAGDCRGVGLGTWFEVELDDAKSGPRRDS